MASLSRFLNLDVVLKSNSDLSPLIEHLGQQVIVLAHEEFERQFLLALELSASGATKDAGWCTEQFLMLIETLPETTRALWNGCTSRAFSFGFERGCDFPAFDTAITSDLTCFYE
jgi:hypothetical protein